jgi:hypothetical protein
MEKSVSRGATEDGMHASSSTSSNVLIKPGRPSIRGGRPQAPGIPRWVIVVGIIVLVLVLLFVILHLSGYGFGDHTHMSTIEQGRQLLWS